MLDSVFIVPPVYDDSYYGYRIHEITEMEVAKMGNYAYGNQPAQNMIYLYDWTDQPWKAQKHIRQVMDRLYSAAPDGYCGDRCEEGCEEGKRLNCYIGEIRLNGTKYNSNFLSHSTLTEGATLHFTLCNPIHHHKPENHRPQCKS